MKLKSGREVEIEQGIGIDEHSRVTEVFGDEAIDSDGDPSVAFGYGNRKRYSASERKEFAEVMIARWQKWGGIKQKEPRHRANQEYRVSYGDMSFKEACNVIAEMDNNVVRIGELMRALCTLRMGGPGSPSPMPFAIYGGGDIALVQRKLKTMKPTELAKAILGATHRDAWASTKNLTLVQILSYADRYVAAFDSRRERISKERAHELFLAAYEHASRLTIEEAREWETKRKYLQSMSPAEAMDWARRMVAAVDKLRIDRNEQLLSVELGAPELISGMRAGQKLLGGNRV